MANHYDKHEVIERPEASFPKGRTGNPGQLDPTSELQPLPGVQLLCT